MPPKADPTPRVARAVRGMLEPGEDVLLGLKVQRPGTTSAEVEGAGAGAVAAAIGTSPSVARREYDPERSQWLEQAVSLGATPEAADRATYLYLVVTTARVLVIRRSRLTGRAQELLAAWPRVSVRAGKVIASSHTVQLEVDGAPLRIELPKAAKFLPPAYRQIAERIAG